MKMRTVWIPVTDEEYYNESQGLICGFKKALGDIFFDYNDLYYNEVSLL